MAKTTAKVVSISDPTNGGEGAIISAAPYGLIATLEGSSDLLFHRWNCEAVESKAKAAKNSASKKTDDLESYVYRDGEGYICIPGEYVRQSMINAARYKQDPRSPRKSAMDLTKAAVVAMTALASVGRKKWDYEDKRHAVVSRGGISRVRPAIRHGWQATFELMILLPEYMDPSWVYDTLSMAGRLVGLGDLRPTYGRFNIVKFTETVAG